MRNKKEQKGITLIALVITIIVLLILSGVALATLTGNSSIIDNANYAVEEYNSSAAADQEVLNKVENMFAKYMGEGNNTAQSHTITYNANGGSGTMNAEMASVTATSTFTPPIGKQFKEWNTAADGSGTSYVAGATVPSDVELYAIWYDPLSSHVSVGDYIIYNPTLGVTNQSSLSYTSPVGTLKVKNGSTYLVKEEGTSTYEYNGAYNLLSANGEFITTGYTVESNVPGNGYGEQSFTATSSNNLWRVLDVNISTGVIKIVPETPIHATSSNAPSSHFYLQGLRAYINAATELNNISAIFGYGQGANGAESITIEEVNALTGYTATSPETTTAVSSIGSWYNTAYIYEKDNSLAENIKSMVFKDDYWLASPCVVVDSDNYAEFDVYFVDHSWVYPRYLWDVMYNGFEGDNEDCCNGVLPVVSLRSDVEKLGGTGAEGSPWTFQVTE